jgi:AcrR family transcriptional regulator
MTDQNPPESEQDEGRAGLRRAAFLKAAREVFLEHGYDNASMAEIVRRAGGSLSTLYAQFGGKKGLFEAMVDARVEELTEPMVVELSAHTPIREGLQRIGERFMARLSEPDALNVFRLMAGQARTFPDLAGGYARRGPERIRAALAAYLKDRAEAGEIRIENFDVAAQIFFDLVRARMALRTLFEPDYKPSDADIREAVDRGVRVFLGGVEALSN